MAWLAHVDDEPASYADLSDEAVNPGTAGVRAQLYGLYYMGQRQATVP